MYQPLIIQHLFQASSLEDVSRERLEAFVESYPSYGIGHYLLSCKLQAEGSDRFLPETQLTCLYFSNPLWLQWLLQNTDGTVEARSSQVPALETVPTPPAMEPSQLEPAVEAEAPERVVVFADTPAVEESLATEAGSPVTNVVTMAEEAFAGPAAGDDLAEALTTSETETVTTLEIDSTTAGEGENLTIPETTSDAGEPSAADLLLRSIEEARGLRESLQKLHDEDTSAGTEAPIRDEEAAFVLPEPEEQKEHVIAEAVAPVTETPAAEQPVAILAEAPAEAHTPAEVATPAVAEAPVEVAAPAVVEVAAPPVAEPATAKKPVTVTQDFLFEPYHTIDYFASQGIKFTLDENPTDNLGKQLKSFTEWLKTMRRLPQKDREVVPDRVAEEAIQTIAAHSVQGKEVLTETMAEVLAKQGMREKARVVYEKLSLLNPDKSAYFAAKIEQLNIP